AGGEVRTPARRSDRGRWWHLARRTVRRVLLGPDQGTAGDASDADDLPWRQAAHRDDRPGRTGDPGRERPPGAGDRGGDADELHRRLRLRGPDSGAEAAA